MTGEPRPVPDMGFEEALKELEDIVARLESGQGTLDDAIEAYERGSALKRHCQDKLESARMRVEQIRLSETGSPDGSEPFNT